MEDPITQTKTINEFKKKILKIGWFINIGKNDDYPYTINTWDEWLGPEDPPTYALVMWKQEVYDTIFTISNERGVDLEPLWEEIHKIVVESAKANINEDTDRDAWHGPSNAPWTAAFIASLIAVHLRLNTKIPNELIILWNWYFKGHWPCAYAVRNEEERKLFSEWYSVGYPEGKLIFYMEKNKPAYIVF